MLRGCVLWREQEGREDGERRGFARDEMEYMRTSRIERSASNYDFDVTRVRHGGRDCGMGMLCEWGYVVDKGREVVNESGSIGDEGGIRENKSKP